MERDGTGEAAAHSDSWWCWFSLFLVLLPLIAAHAGPSNHMSDWRHRKGPKGPQNPAPRLLLSTAADVRSSSSQSISSSVSAMKRRADPRRPYLLGGDSIHAAVRHFLPFLLTSARRGGKDQTAYLHSLDLDTSTRAVVTPRCRRGCGVVNKDAGTP